VYKLWKNRCLYTANRHNIFDINVFAMLSDRQISFLERAIKVAAEGMQAGKGGPFGCVIVKADNIIAEGSNEVTSTNDPTAHAEIVAIREACKKLNNYQLTNCEVYASCEPCPMCLGAIYWARPKLVVYASTRHDAAAIDFDDHFIYTEINAADVDRQIPFIHHPCISANELFNNWNDKENKKEY
jgi:guanine deaminase